MLSSLEVLQNCFHGLVIMVPSSSKLAYVYFKFISFFPEKAVTTFWSRINKCLMAKYEGEILGLGEKTVLVYTNDFLKK